jgi:ABC-type multidrug transport system ATPase subunit
VIELADVCLRSQDRPRVDLGPVTLSLEPGHLYVALGAAQDGAPLLLAGLAGAVSPRRGSIRRGGVPAAPGRDVAFVPMTADLPLEVTAKGFMKLAEAVRGTSRSPPEERLAALGVESLAPRRLASLSAAELRAVALAEALTSDARWLFLTDPLADVDPRAVHRVPALVRSRVERGATSVVATSSSVDARVFGGEQLVISSGKLVGRRQGDDVLPTHSWGARLFVRSAGARFLLAELASDTTFDEVRCTGPGLLVTGKDPVSMASAVATASRRAGVEIELLEFEREAPGT